MNLSSIAAAQEQELTDIQKAVRRLELDITNSIGRTIRDELGDVQAAISSDGSTNLTLTVIRPGLPLEFGAVDLARIDYFYSDNILWRRTWAVLDRVPDTEYFDSIVLSGLEGIRFSFMSSSWLEYWPENEDPFSMNKLPRAIRFELDLGSSRSIDRIVLIPNQS